jgi:hypothetical protein
VAPTRSAASFSEFAATLVAAGRLSAGDDRSGAGEDPAKAVSGAATRGCSPEVRIEAAPSGEAFSTLPLASCASVLATSDGGGASPEDGALALSDAGMPAPASDAEPSGAAPVSEDRRSNWRSVAANPITAAKTTASAISGRGIGNFLKSDGIAGSRRRFYCAGSAYSRDGARDSRLA